MSSHKHPRHESNVLGFLLEDPLADILACDVKPQDIDDWIERSRTIPSGVTGKIVKESTISRQRQILSTMFSRMIKVGNIKINHCRDAEKPSDSEPREQVVSEEEIEKLRIVAQYVEGEPPYTKAQRVCVAFILACCTGMRAGEIMRIERSWINGRTLRLPAEATKTAKGRTIALNDLAARILKDVCTLGLSPSTWDLKDDIRDALWRRGGTA